MQHLKTFTVGLLLLGTLCSVSSAQMKCAPGKCGGAASKMNSVKHNQKEMRCTVCGMSLKMFPQTSYRAKVDGEEKYYCSIHCLANEMRKGSMPKEIEVIDAETLNYIDATKAYYVITPGRRGTMSMVSKLAFSSRKSAEVFAKKHGGYVTDLEGALKEAAKDFEKK